MVDLPELPSFGDIIELNGRKWCVYDAYTPELVADKYPNLAALHVEKGIRMILALLPAGRGGSRLHMAYLYENGWSITKI